VYKIALIYNSGPVASGSSLLLEQPIIPLPPILEFTITNQVNAPSFNLIGRYGIGYAVVSGSAIPLDIND
jgi:hypothetical protein